MELDWKRLDNLFADPAWYATREYQDVFKAMRKHEPVHYAVDEKYGHNYWVLTRYDDIKAVLNDNQTFSNRLGIRIPRSSQRMTPEVKHEFFFDVGVASLDDPLHALYRRPMNKHFSVPAIARLGDDVERYVDEIINEVSDKDEFDLVEDMSAELPVRVILRMLGVPTEDWPKLRHLAHMWGTPADPRFTIDNDPVKTAFTALKAIGDYSTDLALQRRENPQDDFATIVGSLEVDGDKLSMHEMRGWFFALIAGGIETTRNAAGVGMWAFLTNPEQRALLIERPELAQSAVDEVLRWVTPPRHLLRVATEDTEIGGKRIRSGDWVVNMITSANRDETVFDDPDRFDITRTPNEHLALGDGIHKCLGRALVRLELSIFFPKVLAAFPDLEIVDQGEPRWAQDVLSNGLASLRLRPNTPSAARA